MQRKPKLYADLAAEAVMDNCTVDAGFKRVLAHFASRAAGCQYCEAHSLIAAKIHGISGEKWLRFGNIKWPLYTEAEKVR